MEVPGETINSCVLGYGTSSNSYCPIFPCLSDGSYSSSIWSYTGFSNVASSSANVVNAMVSDLNNGKPYHLKMTITGTNNGTPVNMVFCDSYINAGASGTNVQWKDANESTPSGSGNYCSIWSAQTYLMGLSGYDYTGTLPTNSNHKILWDANSWGGTAPTVIIELYSYDEYQKIGQGGNPYHPIDGRYVPIDGSSITLNSSYELQGFSGDYTDLTNKPTIPDAVSGTNDGTNWTSLTIGSDTYGIGGGGSAPTNMMTTDTAQTITGLKTFSNTAGGYALETVGSLLLKGSNSSQFQVQVYGSQYSSSIRFLNYGTGLLIENPTSGIKSVSPMGSSVNLGSSSNIWNDFYINGNITNGTDSAAAADIIALVAYAKTQGWIS